MIEKLSILTFMIFSAIACEQEGNESIPIEANSYCIEEILPCE